MLSQHDPDHTGSASLVLPDETEETVHSVPAKKETMVKESRSPARFWLGLVALLLGLATLATGLIFFSTLPATLAAEVLGAGLALLIVAVFLVSGTWRSATSTRLDLPTPSAPADTPVQPETPAPSLEAPAAAPVESAAEVPPASASQPAPAAEAELAPAAPPETPAGQPAARPTAAAPHSSQNGASMPRARAVIEGTDPRLPALTGLPRDLPPHADRTLIDAQANDLAELLGDVAEQSALVMLTGGQRGAQRRKRLADKIETFRKDMAHDPDYTQVANFLEAMVGLLRAGKPIPASRPLVDPFDGLYDYVLKLIRRKSGRQHD